MVLWSMHQQKQPLCQGGKVHSKGVLFIRHTYTLIRTPAQTHKHSLACRSSKLLFLLLTQHRRTCVAYCSWTSCRLGPGYQARFEWCTSTDGWNWSRFQSARQWLCVNEMHQQNAEPFCVGICWDDKMLRCFVRFGWGNEGQMAQMSHTHRSSVRVIDRAGGFH
jgi:hypothetical protein